MATPSRLLTPRLRCARAGRAEIRRPTREDTTCSARLLAATAGEVSDRLDDDLDVGPRRPVGDVEVVDLDHLGEWNARRAERLPAARDARGERQAVAIKAGHVVVLVDHERTRADETH